MGTWETLLIKQCHGPRGPKIFIQTVNLDTHSLYFTLGICAFYWYSGRDVLAIYHTEKGVSGLLAAK
jgi:hypothetical protein